LQLLDFQAIQGSFYF